MDSKSLCLACSSSLPPFKIGYSIFTTNCCQRPICPSCVNSNPRLARYNPCLACLAGVSVVASTSGSNSPFNVSFSPDINLSGAVRDKDTFVLGDDDEEDEEENQTLCGLNEERPILNEEPPQPPLAEDVSRTIPVKYFLNRSDTLQGLSLRFGVDAHEICRLNKLPPSVLRTTPNLLHTRAFLLLPPTTKPHPSLLQSTSQDNDREAKTVRERAEKRLQTLTKEVDWRIAKAYVALADDQQDQQTRLFKYKELSNMRTPDTTLETLAIERYLDDLEWEAEELKAGRGVNLSKFPFADFGTDNRKEDSVDENNSRRRHWWTWTNT